MSDAPADRPDPLRAWLEATGGDQPQPPPDQGDGRRDDGPSRRLMAATAVVCAAAVVLAVAVRAKDAGGHTPAAPAPPSPLRATSAAPTAPVAAPPDEGLAQPGDPAVAAAALLAVRNGAGDGVYVDTAAVEAFRDVGAVTVVTVRALLLRRVRDGWSPPQPARFAVPVGMSEGETVALAAPWRLPSATSAPPPPAWEAVEDADSVRSAARAVTAAGYSSVTDVSIRRAVQQPGVLTVAVTAVAPGDDAARSHELWLTEDAGTVLGMAAVTDVPVPGGQP